MIVEGRVLGPSYEGLVRALAFSVSNECGYERILLPRCGALPSESPFLRYILNVQQDQRSPVWRVNRVLAVSPLSVRKSELVQFIASLVPFDVEQTSTYIRAELRGAGEILEPRDLFALASKNSQILEIVSVAWQHRVFYELLPLLPIEFLRRLEEHELDSVQELLKEQPDLIQQQQPEMAARMFNLLGIASEKISYFDSRIHPVSPSVIAQLVLRLHGLKRLSLVCSYLYDQNWEERLIALGKDGWTVRASCPAIKQDVPENSGGRGTHLVLVHAHKIRMDKLLHIIETEPQIEELMLVGDPNEFPAHTSGGEHDFFRSLWDSWAGGETWPLTTNHMAFIHWSLARKSTSDIEIERPANMQELRRVVQAWVGKCRGTWVVLCSEAGQQREIKKWLGREFVRLGDRIHLSETDEVGILQKACATGSKLEVSKKNRLYDEEDYDMQIEPAGNSTVVKFLRSKTRHEANDVSLTTTWVGPRVDDVLFVMSEFTHIDEILGTIKYAKKSFVLATVSRTHPVALAEKRIVKTSPLLEMFLTEKKKKDDNQTHASSPHRIS